MLNILSARSCEDLRTLRDCRVKSNTRVAGWRRGLEIVPATRGDRALSNKDIQQAVEDMSEAAGVDDDDVQAGSRASSGSFSARHLPTARPIASTTSYSSMARAAPARRWRWTSARRWASRQAARATPRRPARSRCSGAFRLPDDGHRPRAPVLRPLAAQAETSVRPLRASRPFPGHQRTPTRGRRERAAGAPGRAPCAAVFAVQASTHGAALLGGFLGAGSRREKTRQQQKSHVITDAARRAGQPNKWSNRQHDEAMALRRRRGHR